MSDLERQIEDLRKVIDDQQFQIEQLRDLQFESINDVRVVVGLTKHEYRVLQFLMKRELAIRENIQTALYYDRHLDEWPGTRLVDVWVSKLRRKLEPYGISISTRWGEGYFITPENKEKIRSIGPMSEGKSA